MAKRPTRYQRLVEGLQNHPWLAPVLVIGLALILIASTTDAVARLYGYLRPDSQLDLVAAVELTPRTLDVTLRNLSENEAVITDIEAHVDSIIGGCLAAPLLPTAKYIVPVKYAKGSSGSVAVRHAVPAHGADRFTVGLATDAVCMKATFRLRYNRDRELVFSHAY